MNHGDAMRRQMNPERRGWHAGARRALPVLALGALLVFAGARPARALNPEWSALGSLLVPGLGQAANGEVLVGTLHLGIYLGLANNYYKAIDDPDYIPFDEREDPTDNTIRINRASASADMWGVAAGDWGLYSAFAAYRDARALPEYSGYATPAPKETLSDLVFSPFDWEFLSRPTVFIPLLFPLFYVFAPADSSDLIFKPDDTITRDELRARAFVMHDMVAVGEESFFRGVLNNSMSSAWGEGYGLVASSAIFGLAHSGTANQATSFGAFIFGGYLGWRQQRNEYAIGEGVALHYWWNVLVTLAALREREPKPMNIATIAFRF